MSPMMQMDKVSGSNKSGVVSGIGRNIFMSAAMDAVVTMRNMNKMRLRNVSGAFMLTNISIIIWCQSIKWLNLRDMQFYSHMRKSFILLIAVTLFTMTGCDFFRIIAGRPTSEEIELKRIEILRAEQAVVQARLDSLKREQKIAQDSLDALDSIKQYGGSILNPSTLGGLFATKLEARYYVIVGSYRVRNNAEAMFKRAAGKGYEPALISFRNGMIAVGLCPNNNIVDALEALKRVKKETFCPSDVWVLLNE